MNINKLVKKFKNGDNSAFCEIIKYFEQDLYKIAKSRLLDDNDVCDAVQETIFTIYQSINQLSKNSSFKCWMVKILINKCNDIYKEKYKFQKFSYEYNECDIYMSTTIQEESNLEFNNLIKALNYDERLIVILYYSYGYKTNEISEILNINHSTIRSKIYRIKNKLRNILEENNEN